MVYLEACLDNPIILGKIIIENLEILLKKRECMVNGTLLGRLGGK